VDSSGQQKVPGGSESKSGTVRASFLKFGIWNSEFGIRDSNPAFRIMHSDFCNLQSAI